MKTEKDKVAGRSTRSRASKKDGPVPAKANSRSGTSKKGQAGRKAEESFETPGKLVGFRLEAPRANSVCVAGCFNGWNPLATPLVNNGEGSWECTISIPAGEHQYRFVVDGEWWDDPLNSARCWNEFGTENCLLVIER